MFSKAILIGRIGNDIELKTSKNGTSFCKLNVATNQGYGQNKKTTWFSVTVFGKQAEHCAKYLTKGSIVHVIGDIQVDEYQGKDGSIKTQICVVADNVTFMNSKSDNQQPVTQSAPVQSASDVFGADSLPADEIPF